MREDIGEWTIWRKSECVIVFNRRDNGMRVCPLAGRWRPLPPRGPGMVDDRMLEERWKHVENTILSRLNSLVHSAVDDRLAEQISAMVYNELKRFEQEGWIDRVHPVHEHDCDACIFLGRSGPWGLGGYDYYFCEQHGGVPTVIARDGPEASYKSGLAIAVTGADKELTEALALAMEAGMFAGRERLLVELGMEMSPCPSCSPTPNARH